MRRPGEGRDAILSSPPDLMTTVLDALIEHIPLPTCVFRVVGEDFILSELRAVLHGPEREREGG